MKKFLLLIFSLYLALVFLMPKVELYYTLKTYLKPERVVLTQARATDRWFDLKVENLKLYYDGIESAEVEELSVLPWLLYNKVDARNVVAGKDVKKMFDFKAEYVLMTYSVISPFAVQIDAVGNFGKIKGALNLKNMKLKLVCEPEKSFKSSSMFRELFRKTDEGYVHESTLR